MRILFVLFVLTMASLFASNTSDAYKERYKMYERKNDTMGQGKMKTVRDTEVKNTNTKKYIDAKFGTERNSKNSTTKCGAVAIPTH